MKTDKETTSYLAAKWLIFIVYERQLDVLFF